MFIFNIAAMIALLFILFGILVISAIVLYADEEIDILHEMPDIDSSLFRHELRQFFTFIPFLFKLGVVVTNITLITMDSEDEIWFYIRNNAAGIKIMNSILAVYTGLLVYLCYKLKISQDQSIEIRHIVANCFGLLQALTLQMHAKSKISDAEVIYTKHQYDEAKQQLRDIQEK